MDTKADILKYAALIRNEKGEVLFARKHNKNIWINVGGRVEANETPIECLRREIKEELSCEIVIDESAIPVLESPITPALDDPDKTVQIVWYELKILGEPTPASEIEEVRWVNPLNPGVELSPQIVEYLLPFLRKHN